MANYTNAFGNTDIRFIGQRGYGVNKDPWIQSRSSHNDILLKETSKRPLEVLPTGSADPVYNIAIQNPIAQPGGGATRMVKHRYDLGDLYGTMSRVDAIPTVPVVSQRRFNSGDYSSNMVDANSIQNSYFNAGTRANGTAFVVNNSMQEPDHTSINRQNHPQLAEKKYASHDWYSVMSHRNSVVYSGTAFNALSNPVGSASSKAVVNNGNTYDDSLPPNSVVSAKDKTITGAN